MIICVIILDVETIETEVSKFVSLCEVSYLTNIKCVDLY